MNFHNFFRYQVQLCDDFVHVLWLQRGGACPFFQLKSLRESVKFIIFEYNIIMEL